MKTELFDYPLPPEKIAQHPLEPRDSSRLLVIQNIIPSSSGDWVQVKWHEWDPGIHVNSYAERANTFQGNDNWPGFRVADVPATQWTSLPGMTEIELLGKLPGLNAIGYREILPYLVWESSLEKTIELVQQNSRNYAKRQLTWFRRY
jgi:hypothetical protein